MRRTLLLLLYLVGCSSEPATRPCEVTAAQPSLGSIDCQAEFMLQAARPLDSSLPGALTIKTIIDRAGGDALHFLDTNAYPLHQRFAVDHLGWPAGQPFISEYLYPQRRFLLGSITYYEEPGVWAYELAPYDTAPVEMITMSVELLAEAAFFGDDLAFHPTSEEQVARAAELPTHIHVVTTDEIYAGISYQPLNLGQTIGQVRLIKIDVGDLDNQYIGPREIAVLDRVPNDISVVAAVVTEEFQTPLSHVNVLSQQRRTPNMAARGAQAGLAAYDGQWVRLTVGAFEWSVEPASQAEADAWWEAHKPTPVTIAPADVSVTDLVDVDDVSVVDIAAVGGKAAHYGELRALAASADAVRVRDGFIVPMYFYRQFLADNGLDGQIEAMLADPRFAADGNYRREQLDALRATMLAAPVDSDLLGAIAARVRAEHPGLRMRFRSSTNAEDLQGFSGAGLYTSTSGAVDDPDRPIDGALRTVWASLWNVRAFEEREYMSIDHRDVAMAVLVHPSFRNETANGVAVTANVYDPGPGGEDAFYINVQAGEVSVVQPPGSGIVADQLMYFFRYNNQPATYYTHSTLVAPGSTVLSRRELFALGSALDEIRSHFNSFYDPPDGFGALPVDVEFKRMGSGEGSTIEIKQARPYPGRGSHSP